MREYITADAVANAIRMKRSVFAGAFLVVEGPNDSVIFGRIVDHDTCTIEIAHDRDRVLRAIAILNAAGTLGVLGVIDADFDRITNRFPGIPNVLQTDFHDAECMMLNSPAFDRVLEEYSGGDRVSTFAIQETPLIAHRLARDAAPLGCLRLISLIDRLNLKFEGLSFQAFVDRRRIQINVVQMIREVANNTQKHDLDQTSIRQRVEEEVNRNHNCWQISCGHDITELLSIAIRRRFSGRSSGNVNVERLEQSLRLAYEAEYLRDTQLVRDISRWEAANSGFKVLLDS
jgi:hypothetical protein